MREPRPNSRAAMRTNYEVLALMNILEEGLERSYTSFLLNPWLKPEITGWTTAEAMRNEVQDQKASMAIP